MSVRKVKKSSKRSKNSHKQFDQIELFLFRAAVLIVLLVHLCKFVAAEVVGIIK